MKRKLINLLDQLLSQSKDCLGAVQNKLSISTSKSDYRIYRAKPAKSHYKVYQAKPESNFKSTMVRVGNSVAIVGAFMGVAILVNAPLRAELAKSISSSTISVASLDSIENQNLDMDPAPVMKPVSMNRGDIESDQTAEALLTPEILHAPVPSIAPMAKQIQGKIDNAALDNGYMNSVFDQRKVANFMANKYSLDPKTINRFISHAVVVAKEVDLDPVLLVAVMSVESNFNPYAQSGAGAQGLMQVLTRVHSEKYAPYGGPAAAFKPEANIRVGAYILKSYIAQAGSLSGGLKYYVGGALVGDGGYAGKVMREREQLNAILRNTELQIPLSASNNAQNQNAPFVKMLPGPTQQNKPIIERGDPSTNDASLSKDTDS
jgi:hypothetical protein